MEKLSTKQIAIISLMIVIAMVLSSFYLWKKPEVNVYVVKGTLPRIRDGSYLYLLRVNNSSTNISVDVFGNCANITLRNDSLIKCFSKEDMFPYTFAYPLFSKKAILKKQIEMFGKNSSIFYEIEKLNTIVWKNITALNCTTNRGEAVILRKKDGLILYYKGNGFEIELIKEK